MPRMLHFIIVITLQSFSRASDLASKSDAVEIFIWPLPHEFTYGNKTVSLDPDPLLVVGGRGGKLGIVEEAFQRFKALVFQDVPSFYKIKYKLKHDVSHIRVIVFSSNETLYLGVDESYTLNVAMEGSSSSAGEAVIMANTVYGALRALETLSQLCIFDYQNKVVRISGAPWHIKDEPRFVFRGLLLDTSRHYLPVTVIKQVIESMSYAKLNVLHWHIVDTESFPLEIPTYPKLWNAAYTDGERYTIEDAHDIVNFSKSRGINVMAEIDVPGHAESWGVGYSDLWPSLSCREPLDVSKNFTFAVLSGILSELRKVFTFEFFHLGGDEVNTRCWDSTPHVKKWLEGKNMSAKEAYGYFVRRGQEIAASQGWTPVNWEETLNDVGSEISPGTVIHNWLGPGVCPRAVGKGFRCIYSNQGVWYLDHLEVPWEAVYGADPLDGIDDPSQRPLVLGGEVCMWGETVDASDVLQTIWPRAAAASERLWSPSADLKLSHNSTLDRLHRFRCLLNRRGIAAAPVENMYGRNPPKHAGSCYDQ